MGCTPPLKGCTLASEAAIVRSNYVLHPNVGLGYTA
jgi:hypothetical protein